MLFLGYSFFGNRYTLDPVPIYIPNINYVKLSNGIFDNLFITSDPNYDLSNLANLEWGLSTILWAQFQNSLSGGNVEETLKDITSVLIKRRRKGDHEWIALFDIPIDNVESLKFERFDRYVANNVEYEYALVFVLNNNIEGSYNVSSITPNFSGLFIVSKNQIFSTVMEIQVQTQRNRPASIVNTIDSRYPFVISNSRNNYTSGSVSGVFAEMDSKNCTINLESSYNYREDLMDFLCDGKAKFLKLEDGRIWMIVVIDSPTESNELNTNKFTTSFNWTEIGKAEDKYALYENGFIDIQSVRR